MTNSDNHLPLTPPPKKVRIGRLDTLAGIRKEIGRVYREARRGELHTTTGAKLTFILQAMQRSVELETIEVRLRALEEKANAK